MSGAELRVAVPTGMGQTLVGLLAPALRHPARIRPASPGAAQEQVRLRVDASHATEVAALAASARQWQAVLADWLPVDTPVAEPNPVMPPCVPDLPIDSLGLSLRCSQALQRAGIDTLKALARLDTRQLLALPHLGRRQVAEVVDTLAAHGLLPGTRWPD